MSLEELVGILIIHEQVLQRDDKTIKGKNLTLRTSYKAKKENSLKVFEATEVLSNDSDTNDEDLAFIT